MPLLPFWALAATVYVAARAAADASSSVAEAASDEDPAQPSPSTVREELEELLPLDLLELEVGFDLVPLVDAANGGELVDRIAAIRRNLAAELGIIIPSIHIRDNLRLRPGAYRLLVSGQEVGAGELRPGRFLAMDPTGSLPPIDGEACREPAFGLPARWIPSSLRESAESIGYTVVDPATVAATHVTELLRSAAPELLGRTEAQELLDLFARREPKLVDELVPSILSLGEVIQVFRALLREGVSVRDLRTILEALADYGRSTKDVGVLTDRVRERMARAITARFKGDDGKVAALVLDPRAEEAFRDAGPDASSGQRLLSSLDGAARAFAGVSTPPLVLCAPDVRRGVSEFLMRRIPGLSVLSYREIDPKTTVQTLGVVTA
jgi:flagellar biosynthesis protein FlhA